MTLSPTTSRSGGAAADFTAVVKSADQSISGSTVLANDSELLFVAGAAVTYELQILVIYASPAGGATPDMKVAFGEDATARGVLNSTVLGTTDTPSAFSQNCDQAATVTIGTNAANRLANFWGYYTGNGGTFRVLWAQNTSDANATIMRARSQLRYRVIG